MVEKLGHVTVQYEKVIVLFKKPLPIAPMVQRRRILQESCIIKRKDCAPIRCMYATDNNRFCNGLVRSGVGLVEVRTFIMIGLYAIVRYSLTCGGYWE